MRIGIQIAPEEHSDIASILARFREAEALGFDSAWLGQLFGHDALTLLSLAGSVTERIELGTFVIPVPARHPVVLAQQALTAQLATGGRLCLGIGAGHAPILEKKLGLASDAPVARMREYLEVLRPLMRGEYVKHAGPRYQVRVSTAVPGTEPPALILGALGPRMLDLAERATDGVAVVFAGGRFVEQHVRPRMSARSRIVLSIPMLVTREVALARRLIDTYVESSMGLPVYARTLAAQGVSGLGELAVVGDTEEILCGLDALKRSGVTDLNVIQIHIPEDPDALIRTRQVLAQAARRGRE